MIGVDFALLGGDPWRVALSALLNTAPLAALSSIVAVNRRRLLRPEWSVWKTLGVHKIVGLTFACATAGFAFIATEMIGSVPTEMESMNAVGRFVSWTIFSLFIYVIFFGFLIWWESIERVQASHAAAAREAVLRAEAEARAVRAQFNPHFVFNTLHSLMLLVRADPATAERAIEDVATLIRYASIIQRRDIDAVSLAKELEVARRYVALESLRLQDRLSVEWRVEVEPAQVMIPAFALQTLVENAIKHGIEPIPQGGKVAVVAEQVGESLVVTVRDDGAGADPSDVSDTDGHGLDLLRRRLESRYGADGVLEWSTAADEGFEVSIQLPVQTPEAEPALDVIESREPAGVPGT